ncbi:hypothetical protein ACFY3G_17685 [Streptomyces phaeochromogenes]|uniref:hypothetical protein n=1 Tax=Streptomyces phaeochromogenes TaxID=1923 RepID=UPI0036AA2BB1
MTAAAEPLPQLAQYVERRITELALEYAEVARLAEISDETLSKIRKGQKARGSTYRKLERALRWQQGSVAEILAGGQPTPIEASAANGPSSPSGLSQEEEVLRRVIAATAKELGLTPSEADEAYRRARQDLEQSRPPEAPGEPHAETPRRRRAS